MGRKAVAISNLRKRISGVLVTINVYVIVFLCPESSWSSPALQQMRGELTLIFARAHKLNKQPKTTQPVSTVHDSYLWENEMFTRSYAASPETDVK